MKTAEAFKTEYEVLKQDLIGTIWFLLKERPDQSVDITEEKGIPAIVTGNFDDQESETIDAIGIGEVKNNVIAYASSYYGGEAEYELEEFEVPFLVAIYDSVEKHIALEDKKK